MSNGSEINTFLGLDDVVPKRGHCVGKVDVVSKHDTTVVVSFQEDVQLRLEVAQMLSVEENKACVQKKLVVCAVKVFQNVASYEMNIGYSLTKLLLGKEAGMSIVVPCFSQVESACTQSSRRTPAV